MFDLNTGNKPKRGRVEPAEAGDTGHDGVEPTLDLQCALQSQYWVTVQKSAFGLFRITLVDRRQALGARDCAKGCVIRDLYTYKRPVMLDVVEELTKHRDPPAYCSSLMRAWNCRWKSGAISLDAEPDIRVARVPNQPPLGACMASLDVVR